MQREVNFLGSLSSGLPPISNPTLTLSQTGSLSAGSTQYAVIDFSQLKSQTQNAIASKAGVGVFDYDRTDDAVVIAEPSFIDVSVIKKQDAAMRQIANAIDN